jgi:hypothetical protein
MEVLLSIASFVDGAGFNWNTIWLPLCVMAVITTILFHNILLMFGRAFSIKELEGFAKSEMLQAAATFFIAIFLVIMLNSAMELAKGYIAGSLMCAGKAMPIDGKTTISTAGDTVMDSAYKAIRCNLQARALNVAELQQQILTSDKAKAEFNFLNTMASIFGVTFLRGDWVGSVYRETETMRLTNNLATVMLIGLNGQSAILEYMRLNLINIFLPVGILLRSFYFTRGPGALFIALAIGMYFMFPVFYILLDPGFTPAPTNAPAPLVNAHPYCYATMSSAVSMVATMQSQGVGTSSTLSFASMRQDLSNSYISLMLHPLVALFITLMFVRYMMSVLGGDSYELTKMVTKMI